MLKYPIRRMLPATLHCHNCPMRFFVSAALMLLLAAGAISVAASAKSGQPKVQSGKPERPLKAMAEMPILERLAAGHFQNFQGQRVVVSISPSKITYMVGTTETVFEPDGKGTWRNINCPSATVICSTIFTNSGIITKLKSRSDSSLIDSQNIYETLDNQGNLVVNLSVVFKEGDYKYTYVKWINTDLADYGELRLQQITQRNKVFADYEKTKNDIQEQRRIYLSGAQSTENQDNGSVSYRDATSAALSLAVRGNYQEAANIIKTSLNNGNLSALEVTFLKSYITIFYGADSDISNASTALADCYSTASDPSLTAHCAYAKETVEDAIRARWSVAKMALNWYGGSGKGDADRVAGTQFANATIRNHDQRQASLIDQADEDREEERRDNLLRQEQRSANFSAAMSALNMQGQALAAQIRGRDVGRSPAPGYRPPASPPVGYQPSPGEPNFPGVSVRSTTAAVFGPLPSDIGTLAQRQFWASRCQSIPNDGGSAAQGCNQTLQSMGISPASRPVAVSSGVNLARTAYSSGNQAADPSTSVGRGHHAELVANQCVRTETRNDGQVFTNGCSAPIGMAWCHEGYDCPGDNTDKGYLSIDLNPGERYTSWGNVGLKLRIGACRRSSGYVKVELSEGYQVRCITSR